MWTYLVPVIVAVVTVVGTLLGQRLLAKSREQEMIEGRQTQQAQAVATEKKDAGSLALQVAEDAANRASRYEAALDQARANLDAKSDELRAASDNLHAARVELSTTLEQMLREREKHEETQRYNETLMDRMKRRISQLETALHRRKIPVPDPEPDPTV